VSASGLRLLAALVALAGCASPGLPAPASPDSGLDPVRDGFAYANELYWEYDTVVEFAPAAAAGTADAGEIFGQRCFVMARAARQFFYAARFDPALPRLSADGYRELVGRVLRSDSRAEGPLPDPVTIPGFSDLRELSAYHEPLLKQQTSGPWRSYVQRGNWRMLFPFTAGQQRRTAASMVEALTRGHPPIVHVMNFPRIDINHALLVYRAEVAAGVVHFDSYDPNQPGRSLTLRFDRERAGFFLPPTPYFPGGPVKVYEIYDGLLY
jgi:hypothetical protein